MTLSWKLSALALGTMLTACASSGGTMTDAGADTANQSQDTGGTPDAGSTDQDSGVTADTGPTCAATFPTSNYCTQPGCNFRPITLTSCDTGTPPNAFYGTTPPSDEYCTASATVLVVAAGWCVPCMEEAPVIEANVTQAYRAKGVRVITVYAQDPDGSAPDARNCNNWRTRYSLTSEMVTDPDALTQVYFPNMAYPAIIIVDKHGQIRDSFYGGGMTDRIATVLDQVLAE